MLSEVETVPDWLVLNDLDTVVDAVLERLVLADDDTVVEILLL